MDDILKFVEMADAQQLAIELLVRFQNFLGRVGAWCVCVGGGGGGWWVIEFNCQEWPTTCKNKLGLRMRSRGTKVEKMLTLAPERYTAGFCMVAKVILWCIWNHCIADSIDLHNARAVNFLRKPSKNMSKYYFPKCYIFLSKKFRIEKY